MSEHFDTIHSGRVMSNAPHSDGRAFVSAIDLLSSSSNLALARNAEGSYSLNRTASGAETYYVVAPLGRAVFTRTGETYNLGDRIMNETPEVDKGFKVTSINFMYDIGVANLTSNAAVFKATTFANAATLSTAEVSATTGSLATTYTSALPYCTTLTVSVPVYFKTAKVFPFVEWTIVMQNNGTIKVFGVEFIFSFNLN
jgi:hypothetical protein